MKAIVLLSGGLDSTLAACLAKELGLELIAFNTVSPFCLCNHRSDSGCFHGAASVAKQLGLKFVSQDVSEELLEIIKAPPHGYGSNMNPCIDCRILLFKKAALVMRQEGASFVITGEVLGQRPMSQKFFTMALIEKEAGLKGLVVRPLSAKKLEETIPEKEGWVARDKLLAIAGRGRREQIYLANSFGINDYPCPSGGCLLTDPNFSKRVRDLITHNELTLQNAKLLKVGRHFRLAKTTKLIVGRNEEENQRLISFATPGDLLFAPPDDIAGPTALGRGMFDTALIELASALVVHYCDRVSPQGPFPVHYTAFPDRQVNVVKVNPLPEEQLISVRI
jgi:tRNA U34 2-thiouridine synthase MnmA/TrmU